jgi:chemotaxis protein methyltransferase CheR
VYAATILSPQSPDMSTIEPPVAISVTSFRRFASYIMDELGIKMTGAKVPMLQSRLMRRVRHLELNSLDEYLEYLFHSPDAAAEQVHFIDAVTTNKTDFFRESEHFDILMRNVASHSLLARRCNVWCAGCSTGEEAYTLAMTLQDHASRTQNFNFSILATDISNRVLQHARNAVYEIDRMDPIPAPMREKYLMRSKDPAKRVFRIVPELRARVSFQRMNFMAREYPVHDTFEAVFFRNVMIYFERETQQRVVGKLVRRLATGGHLFIGHSESLTGMVLPLKQVAPAVYIKTNCDGSV